MFTNNIGNPDGSATKTKPTKNLAKMESRKYKKGGNHRGGDRGAAEKRNDSLGSEKWIQIYGIPKRWEGKCTDLV